MTWRGNAVGPELPARKRALFSSGHAACVDTRRGGAGRIEAPRKGRPSAEVDALRVPAGFEASRKLARDREDGVSQNGTDEARGPQYDGPFGRGRGAVSKGRVLSRLRNFLRLRLRPRRALFRAQPLRYQRPARGHCRCWKPSGARPDRVGSIGWGDVREHPRRQGGGLDRQEVVFAPDGSVPPCGSPDLRSRVREPWPGCSWSWGCGGRGGTRFVCGTPVHRRDQSEAPQGDAGEREPADHLLWHPSRKRAECPAERPQVEVHVHLVCSPPRWTCHPGAGVSTGDSELLGRHGNGGQGRGNGEATVGRLGASGRGCGRRCG